MIGEAPEGNQLDWSQYLPLSTGEGMSRAQRIYNRGSCRLAGESHHGFGRNLIGQTWRLTRLYYWRFRRPRAIKTMQPTSAETVPMEFMSISGALVGIARQVSEVAKTRSAMVVIFFIYKSSVLQLLRGSNYKSSA